jgi:L-alanine-DL-glutamate epimerase-like enolase superfamily enzyme
MKIEKIETTVLRMPYTSGGPLDAQVWGGKAWQTADVLLVKVITDDGLIGWGEAFGYNVIPATKAAIDQIIAPMCIGRDPLDIELLMQEMQQKLHIFGRSGPIIFGLSGIDIALWDIAGKAAGLPVHRMLGGGRPQLTCYASMIRYTEPKLVAKNVERALAQGYKHIKLHEIEFEPTRAARVAAGDDIDIMLDVNCPWTQRQALDMAQKMRPLNLRWFEEPVWPPEDHTALAYVRAHGGIPVAAGENATTIAQFRHLFDANAVDFVQPSPAKMGGVSELVKVFNLAHAYNVTVMPHSFYDGPAFLAGVHVNAALGSGPGGSTSSMVEWRYFDLEARLYGDNAIPRIGMIDVPQGPGLGFDPDPEIVKRYKAE